MRAVPLAKLFICLVTLFGPVVSVFSGEIRIAAVDTATVYEEGPRDGERGRLYLNIEGTEHDPYASFGYVVFDPSIIEEELTSGRIISLTLELTHAPSRFSSAGKVRIWLAPSPLIVTTEMRFDRDATPTGLGQQVGRLIPLIGNFDYEPGTPPGSTFSWKITATETLLSQIRSAIKDRTLIHLIITPVGTEVAATFAGADWSDRDRGRSGAPILVVNTP